MNPLYAFLGYCAIGILYVLLEPLVTGALYRANWNRYEDVRSTGARMRLADDDSQAQAHIICGLVAIMLSICWTIIVFRVGGTHV